MPFLSHHHHHPNVQKVKQPAEMQKNSSSVGRFSAPISVGSLGIKFLFESLCNIFLYPRQKLGSPRDGLQKKPPGKEKLGEDLSIEKTICSSITLKKRRDLDVQGWTHQRCLAPESCSLIAIQSRTEEFVGVDHKPYTRCNTSALMPFNTVGLGSELNVSSLQRIVSSLLLRSKLRAMGDKISKKLCHSSINASHHTTEIPLSMNNIRKLCGRSVHIIRCRSTSNNS